MFIIKVPIEVGRSQLRSVPLFQPYHSYAFGTTASIGGRLVPMDKERAMLAGSLARAALELGHPKVRTFGIDPHKKVRRGR